MHILLHETDMIVLDNQVVLCILFMSNTQKTNGGRRKRFERSLLIHRSLRRIVHPIPIH